MMSKRRFRKSALALAGSIALFAAASSAYANPIVYENARGSASFSTTYTYLGADNYGFMEGGVPMDAWKFSSSGDGPRTIAFTVDTAGGSGGFSLYDTTYSGTSTVVTVQTGISSRSAHTYSVTLAANHNYTLYVMPTGPSTYNYHFTLS